MQWFYDLKIATKLLTSFLILALISSILVISSSNSLKELENRDSYMYNNSVLALKDLGLLFEQIGEFKMAFRSELLADSQSGRSSEITKRKEISGEISNLLIRYEKAISSPEEKELYKKFITSRNELVILVNQFEVYIQSERLEEAKSLLNGKFTIAEITYSNAISALLHYNTASAEKISQDNTTLANSSVSTNYWLGGLSIGIAIFFGLAISNVISKPIKSTLNAANIISDGNFDYSDREVEKYSQQKDEIGNLIIAILKMRDTVVNKSVWYESIINSIPFPILVTDMNMNWTYINKAAEQTTGKKQTEAINKQCSNWDAAICKTAKCGIALLNKGQSTSLFKQPGNDKDYQVDVSFIFDKVGTKIGHVEFVQDVTKVISQQKYLEKSTNLLLEQMDKFSNGDLTVSVQKEKDDEIGRLFDGFNQSVLNINEVLVEITEAVQATASASNQISASAEEMAAGAQEQSSQASEVASAVEEMATTIVETTKNANVAASSAKEAGQTAKDGGLVVNKTVEGMNRIALVVERAAETVQALGQSSDQIGEIVQVINDIADQTNLLALNAAIEAARAGEQGRGFAVVADEVRKLAERTTKATKEIAQMIKHIQNDTGDAVASMQKGKAEVETGKTMANKAGLSMSEIVTATNRVLDVVSSVASASEQQASAAEQISKNIESISSVTQESATGVQQIARASEDLNKLTENLQLLVNRFTISTIGIISGNKRTNTNSLSKHYNKMLN